MVAKSTSLAIRIVFEFICDYTIEVFGLELVVRIVKIVVLDGAAAVVACENNERVFATAFLLQRADDSTRLGRSIRISKRLVTVRSRSTYTQKVRVIQEAIRI